MHHMLTAHGIAVLKKWPQAGTMDPAELGALGARASAEASEEHGVACFNHH